MLQVSIVNHHVRGFIVGWLMVVDNNKCKHQGGTYVYIYKENNWFPY
jgi:hypothetical protein